jgi:hypothetical protein
MQSWGYLVGISRQFRTISTIFDTPLPSSLFDSKPSGFCSCYGTYRGSGILHFTVPSPIYEPPSYSIPLYTFGFRFPPLLHTNLAVSALLYPPPYSIPSPVISVVTIVIIEVPGIYFNLRSPSPIYGPLLRFTVPSSDLRFPPLRFSTFEPFPTSSKTSNACITAVIVEVLVYIFRTILGTFSRCLSGCF